MEDYIANLRSIVKILIIDYKVPHKQIRNEIYKTVEELSSKLPKTKVLINTAFGGYEYSDEFLEFIKANKSTLPPIPDDLKEQLTKSYYFDRLEYVYYIDSFGASCKTKYPFITKLIAIHNKYKLPELYYQLNQVKYCTMEKERAENCMTIVNETPDTQFGAATIIEYLSLYDHTFQKSILKYTKESLFKCINEKHNTLIHNIESAKNTINTLLASAPHLITLFHDNWDVYPETSSHGRQIDFVTSIQKNSEDDPNIWKSQQYYTNTIMYFLQEYQTQFEITPEEITQYCTDNELGLLCASSTYCKLKIAEAPQLLYWKISEYDGKESICVDS